MRRRPQSLGEPVKLTLSPETLKFPGVAAPNSADTWVAAVPLYSTVTAPTRGVVTNLQLAIGQFAAAGSPVMTFFDSRGAWITADLRENQIGNIEPGDEVEILFDAMPGQTFRGRVHSIAWGIDPGRTSAGGLMQNRPENQWFEPARRMPVHIELEGGMQAWRWASARSAGVSPC